ncbi:hypothetical protein KZH41_15530 [Pseudomonas sp. YeP6b]|uniref:hypothetical protein n=1 Tax=Pseudomonas sp. YeP6b TaxID=2861775 RepID=UPI0021D98774|nr:hypothetical protein [Pseudomonas sp. YeP6b]UXZ19961.1 hypothetical protein KZH41_15480 [Pseudomonas sp. YeP6b]UXZ19971.1 hypothetical protein KZH41_15530 [Pseudomonas sp. YeP6b]
MDKVAYQNLRFAVEMEFLNALNNPQCDERAGINSLMRLFLSALAQQEVARQRSVRKFKTFRRNPEAIAPSWAYRKPGTLPNLPVFR